MNAASWYQDPAALWVRRLATQPTTSKDAWQPPADVFEFEDSYEVRLDLPAVDPDTIGIKVQEGVLVISGERMKPTGEGVTKRHIQERVHGRFERQFKLSPKVDTESISASAKCGELVLKVAKKAKPQAKTIKVQAA